MKFVSIVCLLMVICCFRSGIGDDNGGSSNKLKLVLSFEAFACPAVTFFQEQLTPKIFQEFSQCPIEWLILPCGTSAKVGNHLTCIRGEEECAMNKIYACAAELSKKNQINLGYFVTCTMSSSCQKTAAPKCASTSKLDWNAIESCVNSGKGDDHCNTYFDMINNDWQIKNLPGMKFGSQYNQELDTAAFYNFKGTVCAELKKKGLQCQACSC